jgi:hypothetical protein
MYGLKTRRLLLVSCALAALLSATTVSAIWHHHNEATASGCQICHIAHLPVLPAAACVALPEPIIIASAISAGALDPYFEPVAQYSPPRAPPA